MHAGRDAASRIHAIADRVSVSCRRRMLPWSCTLSLRMHCHARDSLPRGWLLVPADMPLDLQPEPGAPRGRLSYTVHLSTGAGAGLRVEVNLHKRHFRSEGRQWAWSKYGGITGAWDALQGFWMQEVPPDERP